MLPHSSAMQDIEQRSNAPLRQSAERGISSAGRAPALQAGDRRFDPVILHHAILGVEAQGSGIRHHGDVRADS